MEDASPLHSEAFQRRRAHSCPSRKLSLLLGEVSTLVEDDDAKCASGLSPRSTQCSDSDADSFGSLSSTTSTGASSSEKAKSVGDELPPAADLCASGLSP